MIDDTSEIRAWLRLAGCPGVSNEVALALLRALGPPSHIFEASTHQLAGIVGSHLAAELRRAPSPALESTTEKTILWANEPGNHFIALGDERYPPQLLEAPEPPLVLFLRGDPALLLRPLLAVLLSPNATSEGLRTTGEFVLALVRRGVSLIWESSQASPAQRWHETARASGCVVHPLGFVADCGGQRAAPVSPLGAMVTDTPPGAAPRPLRRSQANRILAGLCRALLMVQANGFSSEYETARLAGELGRDLFAIPGSIHSPFSKASHRLIKSGAKLVETTDDIYSELSSFPRQV